MKTSLTSRITPEQKEQCVRVICDAVRKGATATINELAKSDTFTTAKLQRVLAQGDKFASAVIPSVKQTIHKLTDIVGCLKVISDDAEIVIGPTDGTEILADASDVFSCISRDFARVVRDEVHRPTAETRVEVCTLIEDATFPRMFGGFGQNLDRLCLAQAQIKRFAREHKHWFCNEGKGTLFLFKAREGTQQVAFFVAQVRLFSTGYLVLTLRDYSPDSVIRSAEHYRVIVPKLV